MVKASYLPIHGSVVPSPLPADPRSCAASDTRGVYGAQTTFDKAGFWEVEATATVDGKTRSGKGAFAVNATRAVPGPGDPALPTETLTLTTPDVPRPAIDSRAGSGEIPDPDLHRTTIAASLAAKRPIVAVFATPVYCTSRFCGPVTDLVDELAHQYADRADFVHVEIWRDFQNKTINKSGRRLGLPRRQAERALGVRVGADGRIGARFDNVVTKGRAGAAAQGAARDRPRPARFRRAGISVRQPAIAHFGQASDAGDRCGRGLGAAGVVGAVAVVGRGGSRPSSRASAHRRRRSPSGRQPMTAWRSARPPARSPTAMRARPRV